MAEFKNVANKVNLDDILEKFKIFKPYHVKVMFLVFFTYTTNSLYSANYVFAAEEVSYRCKDDIPEYNKHYCSTTNSSQRCPEWVYDTPDSFIAYFQLPCPEWRTLVGTVHGFGYMCGLLLVGPMSDKIGRKKVVIITGVLGGIFGILRSFSVWYWFYIAMEFLEAAIGDNCSPMYVLSLEVTATKNRLLFCMLCGLGHVCGGVLLAFFAWLIPSWRWFLRAIYSLAFIFITYIYLLDDSPRWLLSKGRKDDAVHILEKAAKINKVSIDKTALENLAYEVSDELSFGDLLNVTFKSKELRRRFLICLIWWITCIFINYGMIINSVSLEGNKYINFALTALVEMPGNIIATLIMTRFNRKKPLMISFFATGILCIAQPFLLTNLSWLSTALYLVGKLMGNTSFAITYMYTSELFPTYTRNSMHALCSSLGRIGAILAPQTSLLIVYWAGLPALVFGLVSILTGLTTIFVPDVSHEALPDTVKQAETMGKTITSNSICDRNAAV